MKQRFSSVDVAVIAHELSNSLCSLRVSNIYDLSSRIFLIKFHKPDHREQLIIESGFRCHLTQYARTTATEPSPFVERLRKLLKTRRVNSVSQVGTDRVIEFQFSDGQYRLFLEFYAAGNIIVTDADLKILALFRTVNEGPEHERLRVGLHYDLTQRQNFNGVPELTKDRVKEGLRKAIQRQTAGADAGNKGKKKEKDALRKALSTSITEFPPFLVDHAFSVVDFDSSLKPEDVLETESSLDKLMLALQEAQKVVKEITTADTVKGYILAKSKTPAADQASDEQANFMYDDFHPFKPRQFESNANLKFIEFDGFNKTADEFFSSIEGQKLENRLQEREAMAKRKLEQARADHEKRLGGLQEAQQLNVRKAEAIMANVERVREAMAAVNSLIEKGMDWVEIARLIEREQDQGNAVARMIKLPLKLYENTITLMLAEESFEEEDEYETSSADSDESDSEEESSKKKKPTQKPEDKRLIIDIDLGLSPWANASQYHNQKKTAAVKEEKTAQAMEKALKSTERKIAADLKKGLQQEKEALRPVRQHFWFEKYHYFLSSDGYLVLGGKDIQQNEILYQRHLKKGDIYVHADLQGAVPLIIKNKPSTPDAPIPPSTLSQAGNLSIATSSAWDSKAIMSAWWVNYNQVSKTGHGGEFLAPGIFVVNGKKNYLPPAQLLLGFGVIFQIDEESKARHLKHRVVEPAPTGNGATEATGISAEGSKEDAGASDSDEEFPDATIGVDDDEDEDFPDAKLGSDSENQEDAGQQDQEKPTETERPEQHEENQRTEDANGLDNDGNIDADKDEDESGDAEPQASTQEATADNTQRKPGHRYITAKERRQLRKGNGPGNNDTGGSEPEGPSSNSPKSSGISTPASVSSAKGPVPRGKRGKAKKAAAKYADQDEEERALAMRLLGVQPAHQKAVSEAITKKTQEEEALAQKERRRQQHLRVQAVGKAAEQARQAAGASADPSDPRTGESVDPAEAERERMDTLPLDCLIGRPLPGDNLLAAIPVCAPWSALSNYKYKVKLQPGNVKKGKAVKEILGRWEIEAKDPKKLDKQSEDREKMWPVEVELIKAWKETEVFGVVPVRTMRVVQSGGAAGGGKGGDKGKGKGKQGGKGGKGGKKK